MGLSATKIIVATGVVHTVPADLRKALTSDSKAREKWNGLTPLARNEWICWITYVKQAQTRKEHLERTITDLKAGERRPCCWPGCPHRNANAKKWFKRLNINIA
jgi:hypothetical protein